MSQPFAGDRMILAVAGDIAAPDTAERIVSGAIERFGRIDTLVNNAGVFIPKPFIFSTAIPCEGGFKRWRAG
jgi:NAD(P)-dependent dehydrogenase (short-subunit alcohol dehydrogenase family)